MYARSTTLTADPERMDDGIAEVRDTVMPAVLDMDGCTGLSMLCDRDSGRCIVTTAWETEEAMARTRDRVAMLRDNTATRFGSASPQVQEWEIAALHRLHHAGDDACARVTWSRTDPDRAEQVIDAFRTTIVPRMDDVPGFCSLSMMIDRHSGLGSLTTVYDDRSAMEAAGDDMRRMREEFTRQMRMELVDVQSYDVVLHHLRVPELV
ncbi:antibiotic biosynthesis monooxygenase [Blastococcus goldschmidtiae]|uniref:Antibiotic biosynthesis monooxygenase n=1 Tax=Blastococcus goldschmidtiae TaxID=3075546 RepID=A0ABU2K904_9ACTN|nr:antibiotic biosynthesis monooxygenase [Blastococcus sp. DSM 46792]MDT0276633.1 antibiotic biosynthesis monooxygenase [Blastococcus sp. DSM 46792]